VVTNPVTAEDGAAKLVDWSFRKDSGGVSNIKMSIYHGPPCDTQNEYKNATNQTRPQFSPKFDNINKIIKTLSLS
jgi:hypothetical protein